MRRPGTVNAVRAALVGCLAVASTLALPGAVAQRADAAVRAPRLADVRTWAFAIGAQTPVATLARYDLVVVDGVDTPASRVRELRRRGVVVLAYVSVGTIERGRPWTAAARPFRLGHWGDWDEWYADVAHPGFRGLVMRTVLPPITARGFDGVFLDNVDMVESHPGRRAGMTALVRQISRTVRARGGLVFVQNGDAYVRGLASVIDGWNREDVTGTYDFDTTRYAPVDRDDTAAAVRAIRWMRARGVFVTTTDYVRPGDRAARARAIRTACAAGARPFLGDIRLVRISAVPLRCS